MTEVPLWRDRLEIATGQGPAMIRPEPTRKPRPARKVYAPPRAGRRHRHLQSGDLRRTALAQSGIAEIRCFPCNSAKRRRFAEIAESCDSANPRDLVECGLDKERTRNYMAMIESDGYVRKRVIIEILRKREEQV